MELRTESFGSGKRRYAPCVADPEVYLGPSYFNNSHVGRAASKTSREVKGGQQGYHDSCQYAGNEQNESRTGEKVQRVKYIPSLVADLPPSNVEQQS